MSTVLLNEFCPTGSWLNSLSSSDGHNFLVYCTSYSPTGEESGRPNGDMTLCLTEIIYVIKGQLLRFHSVLKRKCGREGKARFFTQSMDRPLVELFNWPCS